MGSVTALSTESLMDALMKCYKHKHYRVIVFVNDVVDLIVLDDELEKAFRDCGIPGVKYISSNANYTLIFFENKSNIEITIMREPTKAKRAHMILYDEKIDIEKYGHILQPMIVKYMNAGGSVDEIVTDSVFKYLSKHPIITEDVESPELDEFLDGFKIIHNT